MARTKISEFSATPANNTDIDSINIAEGCAPSGINDAIRELMAQLKDFQTGAVGDSFNGPVGTTTAAAGAFTTLSSTGNTTLGDASSDSVTVNGNTNFANVNPTLTAGTANGVTYLNGSKVLTSGSALTFDGTNLGVGGAPANYVGYPNLRLNGSSGGILDLANNGTSVFRLTADTSGAYYYTQNAAYPHVWGASSSELMRLTSTGLGIGTSTTTNGTKLTVAGGIAATSGITSHSASKIVIDQPNTTTSYIRAYGPNTTTAGITQFIQASSDYSVVVASATMDSSGNLGIGTSSPAAKLDVLVPSIARLMIGYAGVSANYYDANNHIFRSAGGTDRLTLDPSGNLGLGVTPSAWGTGSSVRALQLTQGAVWGFGAANMYLGANNFFNGTDRIYLSGNTAGEYRITGNVHSWQQAAVGTAGAAITFTQAMTLDAAGSLLINTTSAPSSSVAGIQISYNNGTRFSFGSFTGSGVYIAFTNGNGDIGSISSSGTTTAYNTSSDYRLKNITGPITTSGTYIDSLNPVEGTWKADGSTFVGLIAHEAQEVSRTQVATGTKDGEEMQGMSYSSSEMIANMIAELKALRARVAALEAA